MKKSSVKNIKKKMNLNPYSKCPSMKNNNLIKKYIANFESYNNIINKKILSLNKNNNITNNLTNNINILKSPIKTTKKEDANSSKQYTMKIDLRRLKSNDNNKSYSTSINIINNFNMNINQIKQIQLNSTTNNNKNFINFGTSLPNNLNNTNNKILLFNKELSHCNNTNMSSTNRNNNFFNHKKILLSTLNKKINSPETSKINSYISISSGDFLKIKKTVIQKRHKKNKMNFPKNNYSNLSSNLSGIILSIKKHHHSVKNKGKSANKEKRISLIGVNNKKIKKFKKVDINNDILEVKRKQKKQKYSSVDKDIMCKDSKQLFSDRINYKKVNSSKLKKNISSFIKIKKVNRQNNINKSSSSNIITRRIHSGYRTSVNHNSKLFNKNVNNGTSILINSYIKYSNFYNKKVNKK
jgi:hypothetical protein